MLDLACQDSSYEKTMGYYEKNKHMVKWMTEKMNFMKVIEKLKRISLRWERNTHFPKENNFH